MAKPATKANAFADDESTAGFALPEARALVGDLLLPNPRIYWTDFILTTILGYGAVYLYLTLPLFSPLMIAAFVVAGFALFRTGTYIHEIVHLRRGTLPGFTLVWNLVVGIPMMTPSYFYANHSDHHNRKHYGTPQDGEYLPLARSPHREIALYLLQVPVIPFLAVIRFLLITPFAILIPPLRRWVDRRASSYVSNPYYKRPDDTPPPAPVWRLAELAVFGLHLGLALLLWYGILPWTILPKIYALACFGILLNWLRNLAGHSFTNDGTPMSHVAQFEDSITVLGNRAVTALMFPLGLRYHALHHLFPAMPYHALEEAHRRMLTRLSPGSRAAYYATFQPGLWPVLKKLWRASAANADPRPMALWRKGPQAAG